MNRLYVQLHCTALSKTAVTVLALVFLFTCVYYNMPIPVTGHTESSIAMRTFIRLLTGMSSHMDHKIRVLPGGVSADVAHVALEELRAGVLRLVVLARLHVVRQELAAHFAVTRSRYSIVNNL